MAAPDPPAASATMIFRNTLCALLLLADLGTGTLAAWDYRPPYGLGWRPVVGRLSDANDAVWVASKFSDNNFVAISPTRIATLTPVAPVQTVRAGWLVDGAENCLWLPLLSTQPAHAKLTLTKARTWDRPFLLEWVARLDDEEMLWDVGAAARMRFRAYRNGGEWRIWSRINAQDQPVEQVVGSVFEHLPSEVFSCFRRYAVSWDGRGRLSFYIDGRLAGVLPMKVPAITLDSMTYRAPETWLAEVRYSDTAAFPTPMARIMPPASLSEIARTGFVGFQMGPPGGLPAPGYQVVTEESPLAGNAAFGFERRPLGSFSNWFRAGWFGTKPVEILKNGSARAIPSLLRGGLLVPSGSAFVVKLPEGRYTVAVTVGSPEHNTVTERVEVNEKVLGENLRTDALTEYRPRQRTVRGEVYNTGSGLRFAFEGKSNRPGLVEPAVSLQAIEIRPAAIASLAIAGGKLQWTRSIPPPAQLPAINDLLARGDVLGAIAVARRIEYDADRLEVLAWLLGYPARPEKWHLELLDEIIEGLESRMTKYPSDAQALNLWEKTLRLAPALRGYVKGKHRELVAGNRSSWAFDAAVLGLEFTAEEPYFGMGRFLAASASYNFTLQSTKYDETLPRPSAILAPVLTQFPDAAVVRALSGERVAAPPLPAVPADAPRWARLHLRVLDRTQQVIHYWIDQRMNEQGLMGGGLGDDVEMLRNWPFLFAATGAPKIAVAWRKLAHTAWKASGGTGGPGAIDDAEHGTEPISDTLTFLPFLEWGQPGYAEAIARQRKVFLLARDVWTVALPDGSRMFRSSHFSSKAVDPKRSQDWVYCLRAIQPVLAYAWFTRDPEAQRFIRELAGSWREAILSDRDGKPAGISPHVITLSERRFGLAGQPWFESRVFGQLKYPIYHTEVYNLLLAAYETNGDTRFMEPLQRSGELLKDEPVPDEDSRRKLIPGSMSWLLHGFPILQSDPSGRQNQIPVRRFTGANVIWDAAARARVAVAGDKLDPLLMRSSHPVAKFMIRWRTAGSAPARQQALDLLCNELDPEASNFEVDHELRTSLAISTDRVYFPLAETMYSLVTGEPSGLPAFDGPRERSWPLAGAFWRTGGQPLAAWVVDNQVDRLEALLYQPAGAVIPVEAVLWRLKPGSYKAELVENGILHPLGNVEIRSPGTIFGFDLPANREVRLVITADQGK